MANDSDATGVHGYPRPFLRRPGWLSLNGPWDFALDPRGRHAHPRELAWQGLILVPFAPETARSGVGERGYFQACWYRRSIPVPSDLAPDERLVLHFGAVDHLATVWIDGAQVASHEGGYTPFSVDLTQLARPGAALELVVRALAVRHQPRDFGAERGIAFAEFGQEARPRLAVEVERLVEQWPEELPAGGVHGASVSGLPCVVDLPDETANSSLRCSAPAGA